MEPATLKTILIVTLSLIMASCAVIPRMERPIALYKGCPELEGVCRLSKPGVKAMTAPNLKSISKEEASEWVEINLDDRKAMLLPSKAASFKRMVCHDVDDYAVLVRYLDSLKRKVSGQ